MIQETLLCMRVPKEFSSVYVLFVRYIYVLCNLHVILYSRSVWHYVKIFGLWILPGMFVRWSLNGTQCYDVSGCLQIACVILQKDLKSWFAELNVDIEKIQEIAKYVINLFELWKTYDEKKDIQALLAKMPKPKPQPSR